MRVNLRSCLLFRVFETKNNVGFLIEMKPEDIQTALDWVQSEPDLNLKALLLSGLESELFREKGFEPVVLGGSAIEFYTDGAYMSGDTDICWAGAKMPTPFERAEIMGQIPGVIPRGTRSWISGHVWLDLLGELTSYGRLPFTSTLTPCGEVVVLSVEEVLAERVFAARRWVGFNADDDACAKKLISCILRGQVACNWDEAFRIAGLPAYRCVKELDDVRAEVSHQLADEPDEIN